MPGGLLKRREHESLAAAFHDAERHATRIGEDRHDIAVGQRRRRNDDRRTELLGAGDSALDIDDADEELHERWGIRWCRPNATVWSARTRLDLAIAERIAGRDRPIEECAIELRHPFRVSGHELPMKNGITHGCRLQLSA